jgi:hypothetical protein
MPAPVQMKEVTKVTLKITNQSWIYTLSQTKALRACYIQQVLKRYDTWNYDGIQVPEFIQEGDKLVCGEFVATVIR